MGTHYFYALALPDEVKVQLGKVCVLLQENLPFQRWVFPQDLHITLAFLGDAGEDKLTASIRILEEEWKSTSFSVEISHLGVFGKSDGPRILWAGNTHQPKLAQVRDRVFSACRDSGFKLETRPFTPHITLARKWDGELSFSKQLLEQSDPFTAGSLSFQAEKVVLYKTHLGKEPKYEEIKAFPLGSR
jgi:RNA 2',3'-cyclic 3'-phosphodiesterase